MELEPIPADIGQQNEWMNELINVLFTQSKNVDNMPEGAAP